MKEEIEVLDEDFVEAKNESENNVIELNRLFNLNEDDVVDVYEEKKQKEERRQKIITKVQIGMIIFLILFASLFYFFGYDLVEPYIKID